MYSSFCHSYRHDTWACTGIYGNGKLHDQDLKHTTNQVLFNNYNPARPARRPPAFSIVATDREPGTGYSYSLFSFNKIR